MLPYSKDVYYSLFGELNTGFLWFQLIAFFIAVALVYLIFKSNTNKRLPLLLLAALWASCSYFWYFRIFAGINFLAPLYGVLAAVQALSLAVMAVLSSKRLELVKNPIGFWPLLALALFWPVLDLLLGMGWPFVRVMGLHPVPLIFLTFAFLVQVKGRFKFWFYIVPFLLAGVSGYEAFVLGMPQDWLPAAGIFYVIIATRFRR